jgi:hypothetical protein
MQIHVRHPKTHRHISCASGVQFKEQPGERQGLGQGEMEVMTVDKDNRDILNLLQDELEFIEKGGYGRSVRTPWKPTSTFQDSLTCLNFADSSRPHPCDECHLIDFVSPESRAAEIPCHRIALNDAGETIEDLELADNQSRTEGAVKAWLKREIKRLQQQRTNTTN